MDELTTLVIRAQTNDLDAYSALVRRFQDMAVGYAPQLVEELLEAKKKALLHQFETQLDMIMTGIQSTQFGNNPRIIEQKLRVMY